MGVADDPQLDSGWALALPPSGPLAWVLRNDARPGRAAVPGQAHWVAHARTGWSRWHLGQPAAWLLQLLQAALAECLGRPVDWLHCTVHCWRYALPPAHGTARDALAWWDAALGLGVYGDFRGGCGIEGEWLSAQALSKALLQPASDSAGACTARVNADAAAAADQQAHCRFATDPLAHVNHHPLKGSQVNQALPSRVFLMTLVVFGAALTTAAHVQTLLEEKDAVRRQADGPRWMVQRLGEEVVTAQAGHWGWR